MDGVSGIHTPKGEARCTRQGTLCVDVLFHRMNMYTSNNVVKDAIVIQVYDTKRAQMSSDVLRVKGAVLLAISIVFYGDTAWIVHIT